MSAIRRTATRASRFCGRVTHTYDLWYRLGFGWRHAWRIAGTWH